MGWMSLVLLIHSRPKWWNHWLCHTKTEEKRRQCWYDYSGQQILCNNKWCTAKLHRYFQEGSGFFPDTQEYAAAGIIERDYKATLCQTHCADIITTALCRCSAAALPSQWTVGAVFFMVVRIWLLPLQASFPFASKLFVFLLELWFVRVSPHYCVKFNLLSPIL